MKKSNANVVMMAVGAAGYSTIELIWRGHTHWSMMLAGGLSFLLFARIKILMKNKRFLYCCILGSAAVTLIELIFGIFFNLILKLDIWDYSGVPLNFLGQICLLYSVYWALLCIPFMPLAEKLYLKLTD